MSEKSKGPHPIIVQKHESPSMFSALFDSFPEAIISYDLTGGISAWNQAAEHTLGYTCEEMLGEPVWRIIPEARRQEVEEIIDQLTSGGPCRRLNTVRIRKGGYPLALDLKISPVRDRNGSVAGVCERIRLPAARGPAEAALEESERFNRTVVQSSRDCIKLLSLDGRLLWISEHGQRMLCIRSLELVLGKCWIEFWPEADQDAVRAVVNAAARGMQGSFVAMHQVEGEPRWFDVLVSPILGEDGRPQKLLAISRDVTARHRAEQAIDRLAAESEQQRRFYETILSNTPDLVYVFDLDHRFTYANQSLLRLWGKSWREAIGKTLLELGYEPSQAAMHDRELEQVVATRKPIRGEVPFTGTNGRRVYDYIFVPVLGPKGQVEAIAGTGRDVTDRKRFEESIRRSEQRFRAFVTTTSDAVYSMDGNWTEMRHLEGHRFLADTPGPTSAWMDKYIYPEDQLRVREAIAEAIRTRSSFELEHRVIRLDGSAGWTLSRAVPLLNADNEIVEWFGAARDVTERKHAEQALRESEAVLRTVAQEARVGLVMVDKERRYLFANQNYAELLGLPDSNIVGQRVPDLLPQLYDQIRPQLDRAFTGARVNYELFVPRHPATHDERYYEVVYEPRVSHSSDPYVIVVLSDITQRKKTEQHLERVVAQRTAKLTETIGELEAFSYTVAHDMRAPLRAMQSFSGILAEEHADNLNQEARDFLQRIAVSANRMDQLIKDVLDYSKIVRADLELAPVDTQALAEEIIHSYPELQPQRADIEIPAPLPSVIGNRSALTQVFANLLGNAVKFVAPGVRPQVRITSEPLGPGLVRLWFEDNGIGIEEDAQRLLFQMFQRAHSVGSYEGTGIGLAIVRKAVERMGGNAGVESAPGKGSRFWIELRLAQHPGAEGKQSTLNCYTEQNKLG